MRLVRSPFLLLILIVSIGQFCRADIPPEVVERGKKATALVVMQGGQGFGSAFCIDPTGLFVTNHHVIENSPNPVLVLSPGEKEQEFVKARVVRQDPVADLALLKVDGHGPFITLPLGEVSTLSETMEIAAFGYPFGKELALGKDQYPNVTISLGHITSLRKDKGVLKQVQLDASVNPGNSGGPVTNSKGQVVGIVVAGIMGSGVYFAIPVSDLQALVDKPTILLSPVDLSLARQHQEQEFTLQLVTFHPPKGETALDLILSAGPGDSRTYPARSEDGKTFHVRAAPLPADDGVPTLLLKVQEGAREVVYRIKDQAIVVSGTRIRLRTVRSIERGKYLTLANGQTVTGSLFGLEAVETQVGGAKTKLNVSRAEKVTIEEVDAQAPAEYRVVVRQEGKVVGELAGVFGKVSAAATTGASSEAASGSQNGRRGGWANFIAGKDMSAVWQGQSLEITLASNASGSPAGFGVGSQSLAVLRGDFDIQVDYRLLAWPGSNGMRAGMRITDADGGEVGAVQRNNDGQSDQDVMTIFNRAGGAEEARAVKQSNPSGKLRLVRKEGSLAGYSWDEETRQWTQIHTGGDFKGDIRVLLVAWSDENRFAHKEGKIVFSNFLVNRGQWVRP